MKKNEEDKDEDQGKEGDDEEPEDDEQDGDETRAAKGTVGSAKTNWGQAQKQFQLCINKASHPSWMEEFSFL